MTWVIVVNRKLAKAEVYGPFDDYHVAAQVERQLAREPWVKSTLLAELRELSIGDDGHLIRTAYL